MQTVRIDTSDLDNVIDRLRKGKKLVAKAKREVMPDVGSEMRDLVSKEITASLNDAYGKVRSWQEERVGSEYGYAAVSPKANTEYGKYPVGYITNAINSGHKNRTYKENSTWPYRPRIRFARTKGRYFYQGAAVELPKIAERVGKELAEEVANLISGDGK